MTLPLPPSRTRGCPATGRKPYPSRPDAERALARREAEGRAVHCKACARWHAVVEHKRKKAIPRASVKKREEIRRRKILRQDLDAERGNGCQWPGCTAVADHMHEVLTRGRGGSALDVENIRLLCERHHRAVHRWPLLATSLGFLRSARPDEARKVVPRPMIPEVTK